jgi:AcrR family transcriptional regulator
MPTKKAAESPEGLNTPDILMSALLRLWEFDGGAGVSARSVAREAALQVSAIYYHFGDLERLFVMTQEAARARARAWCAWHLGAIGGQTLDAAALGPLVAALVDDWCEQQRALCFAWRECQLMALRDATFVPQAAKWNTLWHDFWTAICRQAGHEDAATLTAWLFDGTCGVHLIRWRRAIDRPVLDEICRGWAAWLDGRLAPSSTWFDIGRRETAQSNPIVEDQDETARIVAEAAARVMARRGVPQLTHRSVAEEAGVTPGVVVYKFRTSADLLRGAFDAVYRRMTRQLPAATGAGATRAEIVARIALDRAERTDMLPVDELVLATARQEELRPFGAQLRYQRGRSSGSQWQGIVGPATPISTVDGAIISALFSGRARAFTCAGLSPAPEVLDESFAPLLTRFPTG